MSIFYQRHASILNQLREVHKLTLNLQDSLDSHKLMSGDSFRRPKELIETIATLTSSLGLIEKELEAQEKFQSLVEEVVNSSLDINIVLNKVMDDIISLTGAERCLLLWENADGELAIEVARSQPGRLMSEDDLILSRTIVSRVMENGEPILTTNAQEDPRFKRQISIVAQNLHSILCVPLRVKDVIHGVIYADNRVLSGLFTKQHLDNLIAFANYAAVAIENAQLFKDLANSYDATLEGWARALDMRDKETEGHTIRVAEMTEKVAISMGLQDSDITNIRRGALLHDIGKMAIPDSILKKEDSLSDEEREVMKMHPLLAYEMLEGIKFLKPALDIPYCHHERWDGNGYPQGLKGEEIPLAARIFSVVDVWDALSSDRRYRTAWSPDQVEKFLLEQSGKMFDPEIVNIFTRLNF